MNDLLTSATRTLWRKPAHTAVTVISLALSVAMLTLLSAVSRAGMTAADNELRAMGVDGFSLSATEGVLDSDTLRVLSSNAAVTLASPLSVIPSTAVLAGESREVLLCGVDGQAAEAIAVELCAGQMPSDDDVAEKALCCVLEQTAAEEAFRGVNALGQTVFVTINGNEYPLAVTGVARAKSSLLQNLTGSVPPLLLLPISTLSALAQTDGFDRILLRSNESADVLEQRLQLTLSDRINLDSVAIQKDRLTRLLSLLSGILTLCGGVSVLVAGGCVLLTQLSTVSERIGEIGLKKALGASRSRILTEFLLSATLLSLIGALAGILIGATLAAVGASIAGLSFTPSISRGVLLLFGVTAFGTLCGIYPAKKAARLSPLEAFCRT